MKSAIFSAFFLLASTVATTQTALASNCTLAEFSPVTSNGSLYHFRAGSWCTLNGPVQVSAITSRWYQAISSDRNFRIHSNNRASQNGLAGMSLNLTEETYTEHGDLTIKQNMFLGDDRQNNFLMQARSTDVDGSGDTKYTQMINHKAQLTNAQSSSPRVYIEKEIKVKKPWFAPESMFISTVKENLGSDMYTLQNHHLDLIE